MIENTFVFGCRKKTGYSISVIAVLASHDDEFDSEIFFNYYLFFVFRAKPQRPGLPPARSQRGLPPLRRFPPPRATLHPLTHQAHQRPACCKAMLPGPKMAAPHLGEAQVTRRGGSWDCPHPPRHPQPPDLHPHHRRVPVCCGWTSTAHSL